MTIMNPTSKLIVLFLAGLGAIRCPAHAAEAFIRPEAWHVDYRADRFEAKFGAAVAIGAGLGEAGRHEASLVIATVPWAMALPAGTLGSAGDGHITPLLASYRFAVAGAEGRWRIHAGALAGATKFSGKIETRLSGVAYTGDVDAWAATLGGQIGVAVKLSPRVALELGFSYLHFDDVGYSTRFLTGSGGAGGGAGPAGSFPAQEAGVVSLGLAVKF